MSEKTVNKVVVAFDSPESRKLAKQVTLLFCDEEILYDDISFPIADIEEIELSICAMRSSVKFQVLYFVDFNICIHQEKYYFQIMNMPKSTLIILEVIDWMKKHQIQYTDVLNVENIFKQYPDELQRWKYINRHFHSWKKQYHLDNPRNNYAKDYYDEMCNVIKDFIKKV